MQYLGIDYGRTKIGLAVSDGQIASLYRVIHISGLADAVQKVSQVIDQEAVQRVVVGLPESGEAHKITKKFLTELKKVYQKKPVEIIEAEETLSSFEARVMMHDLHLSQKDVTEKEDEYAASIILQNFLDSLQ